ncbi:unnamed protein product [Rhodiola kirilowii]
MKRKDFEDAFDDFSCFSLAASARKSRRLDCELPPIVVEELDSGLPVAPDQGFLHENLKSGNVLVPNEAPIVDAVLPNDPSEELAIVLYNPANAASHGMVKSPGSSNLSLVMNPELFSDWRSQMFHQGNQRGLTITELDEESDENKVFQTNNFMAVVPWVASQKSLTAPAPDTQATLMTVEEEPMEADADCEMMETEDQFSTPGYSDQGHIINNGMMSGAQAQALPQQQPHCLMPQYPSNNYTPITW